jgi:hypothetical protein
MFWTKVFNLIINGEANWEIKTPYTNDIHGVWMWVWMLSLHFILIEGWITLCNLKYWVNRNVYSYSDKKKLKPIFIKL